MVIKEWACGCGKDFDSPVALCPACGSIAKRAFRTAPGFQKQSYRNVNRLIEDEFKSRGITNYSNVDKFKPKVEYGGTATNGSVTAGWGRSHLGNYQRADGVPINPPSPLQGARGSATVADSIKGFPEGLRGKTDFVGEAYRPDLKGKLAEQT
jgi:hypothetical protein